MVDGEEQFYVLEEDKASDVETCKELLLSTSPIKYKLDRNPQVHVHVDRKYCKYACVCTDTSP